jgi:hypothetical protein
LRSAVGFLNTELVAMLVDTTAALRYIEVTGV